MFWSSLSHLQSDVIQFTLLDMDMGIEHFDRGMDDSVDLSYESLRLFRKITDIAENIKMLVTMFRT